MVKTILSISVDVENAELAKLKIDNISGFVNECLASLADNEDMKIKDRAKVAAELAKAAANVARLKKMEKDIEKEEEKAKERLHKTALHNNPLRN